MPAEPSGWSRIFVVGPSQINLVWPILISEICNANHQAPQDRSETEIFLYLSGITAINTSQSPHP
jgi:hypothetical protein